MYEILIVEDNTELRGILKDALMSEEALITEADSAEEGYLKFKENGNIDLVITDLKLPSGDGVSLLGKIKADRPETEIIVVTAYGTVDKAVDAMKKGAADFITKPFSLEHVRLQVERILRSKKMKEENSYYKSGIRREIIGGTEIIKNILDLADKTAKSEAIALITGESGTGKEIIAEEIHFRSSRREYPMIKVNCAALAPGVLESELFGHEKGSFTDAVYAKKGRFEMADKGTIFLDEIGDLPLDLQIKILRVLQEREFERVGGEKTIKVNVRVIAATNRDLKQLVAEGKFRQELYYRLNVIEIKMPALRERKEDIPLLVDYFILKYADYSNFKVKGISDKALEALAAYDYPGNIRELENIIQRVLVLCEGETITDEDIPYEISASGEKPEKVSGSLEESVSNFEKNLIQSTLEITAGNKAKAAELLKVNRVTLMGKIKKYNL